MVKVLMKKLNLKRSVASFNKKGGKKNISIFYDYIQVIISNKIDPDKKKKKKEKNVIVIIILNIYAFLTSLTNSGVRETLEIRTVPKRASGNSDCSLP